MSVTFSLLGSKTIGFFKTTNSPKFCFIVVACNFCLKLFMWYLSEGICNIVTSLFRVMYLLLISFFSKLDLCLQLRPKQWDGKSKWRHLEHFEVRVYMYGSATWLTAGSNFHRPATQLLAAVSCLSRLFRCFLPFMLGFPFRCFGFVRQDSSA
jgi:hypothetical protein